MTWGIASLKVDGCYADVNVMNITCQGSARRSKPPTLLAMYQARGIRARGPIMLPTASAITSARSRVPLHQIASTCDSARMWMDISDSWNQPTGNGVGVKNVIDFWAANPQLAELRNGLPKGATYVNDPDQC